VSPQAAAVPKRVRATMIITLFSYQFSSNV
jgi:hypothetical protein